MKNLEQRDEDLGVKNEISGRGCMNVRLMGLVTE